MESITKLVGERIRNYRTKKGLSQAQLAERANCHPSFICNVERGEKVPTIDTIFKICKALDLPMDELFENIIVGDHKSEIPKKFYDVINALPESDQKELYDLLTVIINYRNKED